jgi:antitoxin component of MazEF toxin-antitoxin module
MTRTAIVLLVNLLLLASPALSAWQARAQQAIPAIVETDIATAQVDVVAVDHAKRKATLRDEDGNSFTVDVPKSVVNFAQVKKGDKVTVSYEVSTAIGLQKQAAGDATANAPTARQYTTVRVAPHGQKPASVRTEVTELTATVEQIDVANRKVTLRGPQGNVRTVSVSDRVQHLDQVNPGDLVVVRQTNAVAVTVTK